jgi:hypothetical protein
MNFNTAVHRSSGFWIIVFVLLMQSCAFGQADKIIVYITKTGEKYHRGSCQYLRQSKFEIEINKAKERGYTPCSVCRPGNGSVSSGTTKSTNSVLSSDEGDEEADDSGTVQQCSATTKAGTRCKRTTSDSSGRCWQHQ